MHIINRFLLKIINMKHNSFFKIKDLKRLDELDYINSIYTRSFVSFIIHLIIFRNKVISFQDSNTSFFKKKLKLI